MLGTGGTRNESSLERDERAGEFGLADGGGVCRDPVLWLVDAAGFLRERIAGDGVGAGAGAAADLLVFACAAFAFELARVTESFEDGRVLVDVGERFFADVSGVNGQ